jgi:predicted short-subunit dehydrogenase-like oxidoreductase (DUF2520 family)
MDIVIIGSGNVAAVLGRKFKAAGHNILQIYSRNASAASVLAYEWDTESTNYKSLVNKNADVYIIAVADDAIDDVVEDLQLTGRVVAHTAASVPKEVLKNVTKHYGVFYPLQSLRKEMVQLPDVPIFFDGSDDTARKKLETLAHSISDEKVMMAGDGDRLKLHVAAVIVSNFTNHLYVLAEEYCKKEGLGFKQLLPLIEETALRIKNVSPRQAQTGPAVRNDTETINKHLELLEAHPHLKEIYGLLTNSIKGTLSNP